MSIQVRAIYENGVFRPLQTVPFADQQEVTVTIDGHGGKGPDGSEHILFSLSPDRWQSFCEALDAPPRDIPALRKLLTEGRSSDGSVS